MHCRCPACRRTVSVPPEQVDFLVRCDRCKAFFLARSIEGAQKAALAVNAPAESPGECLPAVHLADLLSRGDAAEIPSEELWSQENLLLGTACEEEVERDALAEARPRETFRRTELRRFELRARQQALGMIGICGLLAVLFLAVCLLVLKVKAFPRAANAGEFHARAATPQPAHSKKTNISAPALPAESAPSPSRAETSGDLFPDVPPAK